MHVVMVSDYPRNPNQISGGVEAVVLYLTQALQHYSDLKLDVVTLDRWDLGQRTVEQGNVTVHYVPFSHLPSRLSIWGNIRRLRAEIVRIQPDLVHAQIAGQYAAAAAGTGLPWVLTLHGVRFLEAALWRGLLNKYRGWFVKKEELDAIQRARHLISISPFIQSTFSKHLQGAIVYDIENPISDAFFNLPQNGIPGQLLFVGRLIPRKDVHTLLRAFSRVHQQMPEATLRLAGGGISDDPTSYYQGLRRFVADAGLEGAVTFLGGLDEPALLKEYSNCAALVLSSVLETAPMVIMQALAAGKPVVSTDAGGARHLVEHGQTGLIVPSSDERALADALSEILSDEATLRAMGRRANEVAKRRFHAQVVAAQTRDVYYDILKQTPPRSKTPLNHGKAKQALGDTALGNSS